VFFLNKRKFKELIREKSYELSEYYDEEAKRIKSAQKTTKILLIILMVGLFFMVFWGYLFVLWFWFFLVVALRSVIYGAIFTRNASKSAVKNQKLKEVLVRMRADSFVIKNQQFSEEKISELIEKYRVEWDNISCGGK
jgi:hypothetical protein